MAWEEVSPATAEFCERAGLDGSRVKPAMRQVNEPCSQGRVDDAFITAIGAIGALRNLVAHGLHRPGVEKPTRACGRLRGALPAEDLG